MLRNNEKKRTRLSKKQNKNKLKKKIEEFDNLLNSSIIFNKFQTEQNSIVNNK